MFNLVRLSSKYDTYGHKEPVKISDAVTFQFALTLSLFLPLNDCLLPLLLNKCIFQIET